VGILLIAFFGRCIIFQEFCCDAPQPSKLTLLVRYKVVSLSGEAPLEWVLTGCSDDCDYKAEYFCAGPAHTFSAASGA